MAVPLVGNHNPPNELANVLFGAGFGALAAITVAHTTAQVGAIYGGAFTMSYLLIDRGLEAIIGDSGLARIIRLAAALIGGIAVAVSVTGSLTGVSMTLSSGLTLSLAMLVVSIVLPFFACCLIPCIPVLPFVACGLLLATL